MRGARVIPFTIIIAALAAGRLLGGDTPPGGVDPTSDHWSFRPLRPLQPPEIRDRSWPRGAVDRFVLARLEARGLAPSAPAARRVLIRRASFELLGLPPSREDVERFVRDARPDAEERLIDRLLASPRYGERWGRHWLDVARFGESHGYESDDERPTAWTFRDAVIRALNEGLPFDAFVRWQLAGDQVAPDDPLAIALTGFLAAGPTVTNVDAIDQEKALYDKMDDVVAAVGASFLGLTVACARCHDHKHDPIPSRDYYRLAGLFLGGGPRDSDVAIGPGGAAVRALVWGGGSRRPNPLLARGDVAAKEGDVGLGALGALGDAAAPPEDRAALARWVTDVNEGAGALAARVIVNRLWQHHFGRGLVASSDDFGARGEAPSHPELLDWLAAELVRGGWELKPLHRMLLASATWMQSTSAGDAALELDPENELVSRRTPRRLEAEAIRDAILQAAGTLNLAMGGPSVKPWVSRDAIETGSTHKWPTDVIDGPATWRRSVHVFLRRSMRMPFLETFDAPDAMSSRGLRVSTTVAPQALLLLNNRFVREQAELFARRVATAVGDDSGAAIEHAYWLALSRPPDDAERTLGLEFLAGGAELVDLCHALLTLNETIYVE